MCRIRTMISLVVWLCLVLVQVSTAEPSAAELEKMKAVRLSSIPNLSNIPNRVPNIFIMGAQKGGSSSLYETLIRHPALCGAIYKEPNFFLTNIRQNLDLKWYLSLFIDRKCLKKPNKSFVDGSCMLHGLLLALRGMNSTYTQEQMKSLKFIVLLREPVSRDFSWFKHRSRKYLNMQQSFLNTKTYDECFHGPNNSMFHLPKVPLCHTRGEYVRYLKIFVQYFRRNQILVLNSNLLFTDSHLLMPSIAKFLNIKMSTLWAPPFPKIDHIDHHIKSPSCVMRAIPLLDCRLRDQLGEYYRPMNAELERWLAETRSQAPPSEPPFDSFGDNFKNLSCVNDSRAAYNKLIENLHQTNCA